MEQNQSICNLNELKKIRETFNHNIEKKLNINLNIMNNYELLLEKSFYNYVKISPTSLESQDIFQMVLSHTRDIMKELVGNKEKYLEDMQFTLNEDLSDTFQKVFLGMSNIFKKNIVVEK